VFCRLTTISRKVRIRSQGVTLQVDVPDTLPEVQVDPMKLEQALVELLANALDAMPTGGTLSIRATPSHDAQPVPGVTVVVRDTGRGIPAEALASVGQPFFTTRQEGTGLGLATARRFVEQHGGRLDLESTPGAGTAIHVWLPVSLTP